MAEKRFTAKILLKKAVIGAQAHYSEGIGNNVVQNYAAQSVDNCILQIQIEKGIVLDNELPSQFWNIPVNTALDPVSGILV